MKKNKLITISLVLMVIFNLLLPIISSANEINATYNDDFEYTLDGSLGGNYPSQGTGLYENSKEKDTIKNFDFSANYDLKSPNTSQILGNENSFDGGYHEYRDEDNNSSVYMKKIVKPTNDPNKFDIQLDVIGGKKESQDKIDIAFVFDKSGSMYTSNPGESQMRWPVLKEAFNYFTDSLISNDNYDVRFALSSFASVSTSQPFYELAQFNDGSYYTNNKQLMTTHPILTTNPSGGTPTFLGVEAGMELLTNANYGIRNDAKKYLIFITDGQPTFDKSNSFNSSNDFVRTSNGSGQVTYRYRLDRTGSYLGNGTNNSTNYNNLLNYIPQRYAEIPNVKKYSIGVGNTVSSFRNVLESIGADGHYDVSNTVSGDLKKVLETIQSEITDSIGLVTEGVINDPMSDFVTLDTGSVKSYQLKLTNNNLIATSTNQNNVDEYAKNAIVNVSDNEIKVNNLSLKGDRETNNGYRITYQVTLKPEFRDGHFYPANKGTFMTDKNHDYPLGFAVPSIKNNLRDIKVEKIWKGTNQNYPTITFKLLANGEVVDEATLSSGTLEHVFKDFPILDSEGNEIEYTIEEDTVQGYKPVIVKNEDGSFSVTNYPNGDFTAKKEASKHLLVPGEQFSYKISVTNTVKDSTLKNLIVEDTMPDGIEIIGNLKLNGQVVGTISGDSFKVIIPELKGEETAEVTLDVKAKETASEGEVINIAKVTDPEEPDKPKEPEDKVEIVRETDIQVLKTDMNGTKVLKDAIFELYRLLDDEETIINSFSSDVNGRINFEKLKSGTYVIKEKSAPDGFKLLEKEITLNIDKFGVVKLIDSPLNMVSLEKNNNIFQLNIKNEEYPPGGILPQTGGNGHTAYTSISMFFIFTALSLLGYYLYRNRKGWR